MLVIASNTHFLEWIRKVPYEVRVLKVNLVGLSKVRKAFFWASLKPKLKILTRKYDVIFCDWFDELASIMSRVSSKPILVRLHRHEAHNPVHIKTAKLENIKGIITVSKFYERIVKEIVGNEVPIYVLPNGVDTEKFSFNPNVHNPLTLCTVSNLVPRKRIFDLIVNNPDLKIDIGGEGEEKRILQDAIKRFGLKAKLHGFVRLPEFYHQHDIFIMNSSDEGHSLALLEAMSCGLIPLCFAYHGVEETLPSEYLYYDYQELNEKLHSLREMSRARLKHLKREIRGIVEAKFTLELQAQNFMSIIEGLKK